MLSWNHGERQYKRALRRARRAGVPTNPAAFARRVVGARNLPALGFRAFKDPSPEAGLPGTGDAMDSGCKTVDPQDGATIKPYVLPCVVQLAGAGALAIDTVLDDFLLAANSDDITANNTMPFDITVERAQMIISLNELIASPVATPAWLNALYIKFVINNTGEEARWPLAKFNPIITNQGLVTSGAGAAIFQTKYDPVPFPLELKEGKRYDMDLYTSRAFTPAAAVQITLLLEGKR